MTELEKLNAGLPYNFMDPEVDALRLNAVRGCEELNALSAADYKARETVIRQIIW